MHYTKDDAAISAAFLKQGHPNRALLALALPRAGLLARWFIAPLAVSAGAKPILWLLQLTGWL